MVPLIKAARRLQSMQLWRRCADVDSLALVLLNRAALGPLRSWHSGQRSGEAAGSYPLHFVLLAVAPARYDVQRSSGLPFSPR